MVEESLAKTTVEVPLPSRIEKITREGELWIEASYDIVRREGRQLNTETPDPIRCAALARFLCPTLRAGTVR